jgi:hypothetical protein
MDNAVAALLDHDLAVENGQQEQLGYHRQRDVVQDRLMQRCSLRLELPLMIPQVSGMLIGMGQTIANEEKYSRT